MVLIKPDLSSVAPDIKPSKKEMLSIRPEGGKHFVSINSSSLSIILTCPRKSYYSLLRELKSRSESPALTFGKAIHKALEIFYATPREDRSIPAGFEDHAAVMPFGTEPPEKHFLYDCIQGFIDEAKSLELLADQDKRSIPNGIWTLCHYFNDYINDAYEIYSDDEGPFVERTFRCIVHDSDKLQITLFGTIDFVMKHTIHGTLLPGDHKTVSQLGADFYNRLKPNHQYTAYLLGLREVYGIESQNFMINGVQVKPRPKTSRGTPPSFVRQITDRTEQDIAEFKISLVEAVERFVKWHEADVWPLGNVDSCAMWGGCQYLDVCSAPDNLRNNILESKFTSMQEGE